MQQLQQLLADYTVFYQKIRNYHWNVKGPQFFQLHEQFEQLYLATAVKVDDIAERIVTKKGRVPGTLAHYLEATTLSEGDSGLDGAAMVNDLIGDFEKLDVTLRQATATAAKADDMATANLLEGFADEQEKTTWMFRAFLG
ncbi:MAG: DNA starvation/stationary phase protection protein [Planctomycetota bacterium]